MKRLPLLAALSLSACGKADHFQAGETATAEQKWQVAIAEYSIVVSSATDQDMINLALERRGFVRLESGDKVGVRAAA
jgi:hypothetical protein